MKLSTTTVSSLSLLCLATLAPPCATGTPISKIVAIQENQKTSTSPSLVSDPDVLLWYHLHVGGERTMKTTTTTTAALTSSSSYISADLFNDIDPDRLQHHTTRSLIESSESSAISDEDRQTVVYTMYGIFGIILLASPCAVAACVASHRKRHRGQAWGREEVLSELRPSQHAYWYHDISKKRGPGAKYRLDCYRRAWWQQSQQRQRQQQQQQQQQQYDTDTLQSPLPPPPQSPPPPYLPRTFNQQSER